MSKQQKNLPAILVALAGWVMPGLGYFLIGQRARGYIAFSTIVLTYVAGLLIGGVRVIDVPGYDTGNNLKMVKLPSGQKSSAISENPMGEVLNKPWYIAQTLIGPINVAGTMWSLNADVRPSTARVFDIGTLYTAVAGMLNLLVIIDAAHRAAHPRAPEETHQQSASPEASAAEPPAGSAA